MAKWRTGARWDRKREAREYLPEFEDVSKAELAIAAVRFGARLRGYADDYEDGVREVMAEIAKIREHWRIERAAPMA